MRLMQGDCLELMREIPDGSVDMVLADPPYGRTENPWDRPIPLAPLWEQYRRVAKKNAAIVLFSQLPFSAELVMSNRKAFRYEWVWAKGNAVGFLNANRMPLRAHENILVFYDRLPTYNPQFTQGEPYTRERKGLPTTCYKRQEKVTVTMSDGRRYPVDVLRFCNNHNGSAHPTQKPVALLEYLIRTYTDEGETVLDSCMGGGSTGVACARTGRDFIGIELDAHYFQVAKGRIQGEIDAQSQAGPEPTQGERREVW